MISRRLGQVIPRYARDYPVVAIVGPRQSGKTTLARSLFPDYPYYTLESLDHRNRALSDPRGFLSDIGPRAILDEVQRAPELFSYLQEYVDASPKERHLRLCCVAGTPESTTKVWRPQPGTQVTSRPISSGTSGKWSTSPTSGSSRPFSR